MKRTTKTLLFALAGMPLLTISSTAEEKFTSLFNGKDLSGWVTVGTKGSFKVDNGTIRTTGAHPYPSWLRSEKEYENFVLKFSYKPKAWYEGGVLIHAPEHGPGSMLGMKLHLTHTTHPYGTHSTGAIYKAAAPLAIPLTPKKWNQIEITCDWPKLQVKMNGTLIQNIDMSKNPAFKHRLRRGYIGLQNICNSNAFYKDIQIRTLPDQEKWTSLFASGLAGLKLEGKSKWTIEEDTLTAKGNNAMAWSKEKFTAPYEFQVWVKTMVNVNGGVVFNSNEGKRGVEIQCFNTPDTTNPTGSLYGIAPASHLVSRDEEWFLIQLFNNGASAEVFVNGEKVSETKNLKPPYSGFFGFQQHTPKGHVSYRSARIRKIR